jgi:hypothetical protein
MSFDNANEMAKVVDQYWRDDIQETEEFGDGFWQRCQKLPEVNVNQKGEKWKVRTGYNQSESGSNFDGGTLATGGNSKFQNLFVPYRTVSHTGLLTQEAIDNDDAKSKYHPVVEEMNATKMVAFKQLQRHLLMGNGTGAIGVLTAPYDGTNSTTKKKLTAAPGTDFGNKGCQFVPPSKVVQICDPTGATVRAGTIGGTGKLVVSDSTLPVKSTGVITFTTDAPSDAIDDDIIVPEGMGGRGVHGLPYWVANAGPLFDLARSSYPGLKSVMVDGSSGALMLAVETFFSTLAHYIDEEVALGLKGEGKHEMFWSPTQREKYRKECIGLGIVMLGSDKIDAGFAHREEINGYDATTMKDHDNTKINILRMQEFYRIGVNAAKPFDIYKVDGKSTLYNIRNSDGEVTTTLGFTLRAYVNLACKNVRNQGAIYNLPTTNLATGNA